MSTVPDAAPARHTTGESYAEQLAVGHVAFASFLLEYRDTVPLRPGGSEYTVHLPDEATLREHAGALEMPVTRRAGMYRAEKRFGPFVFALWTEDTEHRASRHRPVGPPAAAKASRAFAEWGIGR